MDLPLTGERTAPDVPHENYWFRRHEVAYDHCAALIARSYPSPAVLDAGAGEGYGASLIRERTGGAVTTIDYDETAITHAHLRYHLQAVRGNLVAMPLADATFDVVLSMQTIEHLWDQKRFIAECARVVRPGGMVILSTPNRLTFPAGNPFHTHEFTGAELADLVTATLRVTHVLGVHHGSRLASHPDLIDSQLASEPSDWPDELSALVASVTADDFVLTPDDVDASLDLYVIAVRA